MPLFRSLQVEQQIIDFFLLPLYSLGQIPNSIFASLFQLGICVLWRSASWGAVNQPLVGFCLEFIHGR